MSDKMKKAILVIFVLINFAIAYIVYAGEYGNSPYLVAPDGTYLGNVNNDMLDPNSINNPYGDYGSRFSDQSINNPYSDYGNKFNPESPNYIGNGPDFSD